MTNPELDVAVAPRVEAPGVEKKLRFPPVPHARAGGISGLLELLVDQGGREDLPVLANRLRLDVDDLLTIVDAADLLDFAAVEKGDLTITEVGRQFAVSDISASKEIFRQQLTVNVPLAVTIYQTLQEKTSRTMGADFFLDILDEIYPADEAIRQFETVVDWGRYAELFEYDAGGRQLYLPRNEDTTA
jgi:NitT/TauT family transport system ATP-binding protein